MIILFLSVWVFSTALIALLAATWLRETRDPFEEDVAALLGFISPFIALLLALLAARLAAFIWKG